MKLKVDDIVIEIDDTFNQYKVIYVDGDFVYLVERLMGCQAYRVKASELKKVY